MSRSNAARPSRSRAALLRHAAFAAGLCLLSGCGGHAGGNASPSPAQPSASEPSSAPGSAAASPSSTAPAAPSASPSSPPASSPPASGATGDTRWQLERMSLEEKIGQMILAGFDGTTSPDAATLRMIKEDHIGGVILYKDNIADVAKTVKLINAIKSANAKADNPPIFVSVDQEGGKVSRLPASYEKIPEAAAVGRANDEALAAEMGRLLAREVRSVGFNVDFAPVLDINSNPDNPVIGTRSFGVSADIVTKAGLAAMRGMREEGIVSVVKHFPGHGDTAVDSHLDLPELNKTADELAKLEWLPFEAAIGEQADAVMVAHILFPKIDPEAPASFSKVIIGDQLRGQLGYKGVVITDDMTMGAIAKHYDLADAVVRSVEAGSDILLAAHGYDIERTVYKALLAAVKDGRLSEVRIDESVARILALKAKYKLSDAAVGVPKLTALNGDIAAWKSKLKQAGG